MEVAWKCRRTHFAFAVLSCIATLAIALPAEATKVEDPAGVVSVGVNEQADGKVAVA